MRTCLAIFDACSQAMPTTSCFLSFLAICPGVARLRFHPFCGKKGWETWDMLQPRLTRDIEAMGLLTEEVVAAIKAGGAYTC